MAGRQRVQAQHAGDGEADQGAGHEADGVGQAFDQQGVHRSLLPQVVTGCGAA